MGVSERVGEREHRRTRETVSEESVSANGESEQKKYSAHLSLLTCSLFTLKPTLRGSIEASGAAIEGATIRYASHGVSENVGAEVVALS